MSFKEFFLKRYTVYYKNNIINYVKKLIVNQIY